MTSGDELGEGPQRFGLARLEDERRHAAIAERGNALGDPVPAADERNLVEAFVAGRSLYDRDGA